MTIYVLGLLFLRIDPFLLQFLFGFHLAMKYLKSVKGSPSLSVIVQFVQKLLFYDATFRSGVHIFTQNKKNPSSYHYYIIIKY